MDIKTEKSNVLEEKYDSKLSLSQYNILTGWKKICLIFGTLIRCYTGFPFKVFYLLVNFLTYAHRLLDVKLRRKQALIKALECLSSLGVFL